MRVKNQSVSLHGICPQIFWSLAVADSVYREHGAEVVITSGSEQTARHRRSSLHYTGHAVDLRTKNLPVSVDRAEVAKELGDRVGADFDVVLEGLGEASEHIHVEWQPKRRS